MQRMPEPCPVQEVFDFASSIAGERFPNGFLQRFRGPLDPFLIGDGVDDLS
jgi:hypothetical protein